MDVVDESLDETSRRGSILNEDAPVSCEGRRVQASARRGDEARNGEKRGAARVSEQHSTQESRRAGDQATASRAARREEAHPPKRRGETIPGYVHNIRTMTHMNEGVVVQYNSRTLVVDCGAQVRADQYPYPR